MDLTLTTEDAELLADLLEKTARELSYEIANPDTAAVKRDPRERQERIAKLQQSLSAG